MLLLLCTPIAFGQNNDSLRYPIHDRYSDVLSSGGRSTFDLDDPSNIKDSVVYDAITRRYTIYEKIGNKYYRVPTTYSFDEYWQMRNRQAEEEYFRKMLTLLLK